MVSKRTLNKSEAAFYGKFVDGAYAMYERDPQNPRPLPQADDIPSGYQMVAWIQMSDFFSGTGSLSAFMDSWRATAWPITTCSRCAELKAWWSGWTTPSHDW